MKPKIAIAFFLLCHCSTAAHAVVTFDWAVVGNPGNGPDDTGFGAVDYVYRISKHEVTNAQYAEFLNAVGPAVVNLRGLYSGRMSSDSTGGIGPLRDGKYPLKPGRGNNPVNYVSFLDAMRFVNWLHNGQPTDGSGTEDGVYAIRDGVSEIRNPSGRYFIPSENEWYKAAYHKNNGATGGAENYWKYPTSTDAEPYSDEPPGSDAPDPTNTGNFPKSDGVANGYNDGFANSNGISPLTDVGAYAMSVSPYGTFDQGGNVQEWNDTLVTSSSRGWRGGAWFLQADFLSASSRFGGAPRAEDNFIGFRVASVVPEASSGLMAVLGLLTLVQRRRTRR